MASHGRRSAILSSKLSLTQSPLMTETTPVHDAGRLTRHREQLPPLAEVGRKVVSIHANDPNAPDALTNLLHRMIDEMEAHIKKVKITLFPGMRSDGAPGLEIPISVVRADHVDHDREIAEIRRLTGNLTLPERRLWYLGRSLHRSGQVRSRARRAHAVGERGAFAWS